MPYGNEPGGKNAGAYLARYVAHYQALDPRRLWTSASGWPELPENQFHVTPDPRLQHWGAGLASRLNARPPETTTDYRAYVAARKVPVLSHEIGEWCVYPNFDEIPKYTGYLKPKNFGVFHDVLAEHGLASFARPFLLASGKLQTLCYKEDIESALRTPGMGGFELLDLHDFPGQGTALVGVLDPFWEEKGYVTAREYRRFCGATVPLARLAKRVFTTAETLEADLEAAHFGPLPIVGLRDYRSPGLTCHPLTNRWNLRTSDGVARAAGQFVTDRIPVGGLTPLGRVVVDLRGLPAPARYKLTVRIHGQMWWNANSGRDLEAENDWDLWVYPDHPATGPTNDTLVRAQFDAAAQAHLQAGGRLLLTVPGAQVRNYAADPVKLGFSSIFWNTAWTGRQAPTTLGLLCDPTHPALAGFPTEDHSNWQWWYLLHRAGALRLDLLPRGLRPVVRLIDDWTTARPLALILEGRVGAGRILVCGFDLTHGAEDPVSRQMRSSLLAYMASPRFAPTTALTVGQLERLVTPAPAPASP